MCTLTSNKRRGYYLSIKYTGLRCVTRKRYQRIKTIPVQVVYYVKLNYVKTLFMVELLYELPHTWMCTPVRRIVLHPEERKKVSLHVVILYYDLTR